MPLYFSLTLLENDPQQTHIRIELEDEYDDRGIARALERNQYVSRVRLRPPVRNNRTWDHLCRVLATRGNLEQFVLFDHEVHFETSSVPAERIRPILQAIQQNTSVCAVEFDFRLLSAQDICTFLDTASHVTDFTVRRCYWPEGAQGARDIAAALQRNTNIETLNLLDIRHSLVPILEGLGSNACVQKLVMAHLDYAEATRNALQGLLESSTASVQHLELKGTNLRGVSFRPVAQGLIHGSNVTDITLNSCYFCDAGSLLTLNDIYDRKQNLRALAIKNCSCSTELQLLQQTPLSALRHPYSSLRRLHLQGVPTSVLSDDSFRVLLEAVTASKLESFFITVIPSPGRIQVLADTIPSMKVLRELLIQFQFGGYNNLDPCEFGGYNNVDHMKQTICKAVKKNYFLQSVKYQDDDDDNPVDASDNDETLKFYLGRNIRLARWVENPATVPKHLWKEACTLAAKAGPTVLFRLLRKIGPEVLPVGSRKRKRRGQLIES